MTKTLSDLRLFGEIRDCIRCSRRQIDPIGRRWLIQRARAVLRSVGILELGILLIIAASPAAAESPFFQYHGQHFKGTNATVYAGTKPYCPSAFQIFNKAHFAKNAVRNYRRDIESQMKKAGFPPSTIAHCVESGAYLSQGGKLTNHPKNRSYNHYVTTGMMAWTSTQNGEIKLQPYLLARPFKTSQDWLLLGPKFKELCRFSIGRTPQVTMRCRGFGSVSGRFRAGTRHTFTFWLANDRFRMVAMEQTTPRRLRSELRKFIN